jgi:hypothetical protein
VVADEEAIVRGEIARHAVWSDPVVQARTGVLHQLRGGELDDFTVGWESSCRRGLGFHRIIFSLLAGATCMVSWGADLGVRTSMTARFVFSLAHVVTANAYLRSRSAGLCAYLPAANASVRLPELTQHRAWLCLVPAA